MAHRDSPDDYHRILTNFLHKNALNWLFSSHWAGLQASKRAASEQKQTVERKMVFEPRWEVEALLKFN